MKVHVPTVLSTLLTDGSPGILMPDSCAGFVWLPPGATDHTSCGNTASSAPKFHRTVSPAFRLAAAGDQRSPSAATSTVLAAGPPGAGSVAENLTLTGPEYVLPAPGAAGSSDSVVTGAV